MSVEHHVEQRGSILPCLVCSNVLFYGVAAPQHLASRFEVCALRANIRETVDPLEFSVQGGEAKRA